MVSPILSLFLSSYINMIFRRSGVGCSMMIRYIIWRLFPKSGGEQEVVLSPSAQMLIEQIEIAFKHGMLYKYE